MPGTTEFTELSPKFTSDPDINGQAEVIFNLLDAYNYNKAHGTEFVYMHLQAQTPPVEGDLFYGDPVEIAEENIEIVK